MTNVKQLHRVEIFATTEGMICLNAVGLAYAWSKADIPEVVTALRANGGGTPTTSPNKLVWPDGAKVRLTDRLGGSSYRMPRHEALRMAKGLEKVLAGMERPQ